MSIAGLVLGVFAAASPSFLPVDWWWVSILAGVAGIVISAIALKKAKAEGGKSGLATAGLIVSIIATVLSAILFISCQVCAAAVNNAIENGDLNVNELLNALNSGN